jgi:hypothetical protein
LLQLNVGRRPLEEVVDVGVWATALVVLREGQDRLTAYWMEVCSRRSSTSLIIVACSPIKAGTEEPGPPHDPV